MCGAPRCREAAALAAAQRSGERSNYVGLSPDNPYLIGEPVEGVDPVRVTVIQNIGPLKAPQSAWVAGDGVQAALDAGTIIPVGSRTLRGRLWRVGQRTYHDKTIAERVAATTGQTMVEVA